MEKWITVKQLQKIAEIGETRAGQIIKEVNDEIEATNGIVPIRGRAPRSIVLGKMRINDDESP